MHHPDSTARPTREEKIDTLIVAAVGNIQAVDIATKNLADQRTQLIELIGQGNNYDHDLAKVLITSQTETRVDPNHLIPVFNAEAYNNASAAEKARLAKAGIVRLEPKQTRGTAPTCRITQK